MMSLKNHLFVNIYLIWFGFAFDELYAIAELCHIMGAPVWGTGMVVRM